MRNNLADNPERLREVVQREGAQLVDTPDPDKIDFRSCDQCAHLFVCDIAKHTATMLASQYDEKHQPFKYQNLAKICTFFQLRTGEITQGLATK